MSGVKVKLTKNDLRDWQRKLAQLEKYLPTLKLKKALLQGEINSAMGEKESVLREYRRLAARAKEAAKLLTEEAGIDPVRSAEIEEVERRFDNIAGVEVPFFSGVRFTGPLYSLLTTPPWVDGLIQRLRDMAAKGANVRVVEERIAALEEELREVSIRVNLFEKVLIPRAREAIKIIRVFLGDQDLAAVGRAKVAKSKLHKGAEKEEEIGELSHAI